MLFGTIYGDIAGSTYEFKSVKDYNFTTIPPKSHFTDDTVMTLAVANWLMTNPNDLKVLVNEMQQLGRIYHRAGYGGMFRKWLGASDPQPYGSFGNGSAMRVSPCAWFAKSLAEAEELAKQSAIVTHDHPEGIKGAQAVAAAIWMARKGWTKEEIKEYISKKYNYNLTYEMAKYPYTNIVIKESEIQNLLVDTDYTLDNGTAAEIEVHSTLVTMSQGTYNSVDTIYIKK